MSSRLLAPLRLLARLFRRRPASLTIAQERPSEGGWQDLQPSECISFEEYQRRMAAHYKR